MFFGRSETTALPDGLLPVASVCLEQEDSLCVLVPFAGSGKSFVEKIANKRVPLPARSEYISENRGTILGKSSRGRVHPAIVWTRQGKNGRRPISCVRFTL